MSMASHLTSTLQNAQRLGGLVVGSTHPGEAAYFAVQATLELRYAADQAESGLRVGLVRLDLHDWTKACVRAWPVILRKGMR